MDIKERLTRIVGEVYVKDSPGELEAYSRDLSPTPPRRPNFVVSPGTAGEVAEVVRLAREHRMPVVPSSSEVHFTGGTVPAQGGIVLDLRRLDRILEVDTRNRRVRLEPGVTWPRLQEELEKYELMALMPLHPHPGKSVLTSLLEREPPLITKFEYAEPLLTMELVLGTGEVLRTGSACVPGYGERALSHGVQPEGPGLDFFKLVQGAQGTMGIVTWANIKAEYLPRVNKLFFYPGPPERLVEFTYRLLRRHIGHECLLLERLNLALLADVPEDGLPPWTGILVLSGGPRRPHEKVAYEEKALREIAEETGVELRESLPGLPGPEEWLSLLRRPRKDGKEYWKLRRRGCCLELFFITVLERAPDFVGEVARLAAEFGFPGEDLSFYIQPLERGRACHFEADLYYGQERLPEARSFHRAAVGRLLNLGALFTRPYGPAAETVFSRAAAYTAALRKVKSILDPDNILNPGKLCF